MTFGISIGKYCFTIVFQFFPGNNILKDLGLFPSKNIGYNSEEMQYEGWSIKKNSIKMKLLNSNKG